MDDSGWCGTSNYQRLQTRDDRFQTPSKFLNEMQSYFSCEKRTLDHWTTVQLIPCKMLLMSLFQEGFVLGICWRNLCTVALDALTQPLSTPCEALQSSWNTLTRQSCAVVIFVSFASFPTLIFPSCQLSVHILQFSTLWTASPVSSYLLWLTPHGVYWLSPSVAVLTWIGVP